MSVSILSPVVSAPLPPAAAVVASCPLWCVERNKAAHRSAGAGTAHFGAQVMVPNPRPLPDETAALWRAELFQDARGEVQLYVQGETSVDLSAVEADVLIAQAEGFVATLRALRAQMG